ncbi:MAG: hypothetical protein N3A58_07615 [Spirochaetes bacterium]|nr:hypothetical protein [Spirochaetota bacterium]
MRLKKIEDSFLNSKRSYLFFIVSAFINSFIFSFGYFLSITFFKEIDPHLYLFISSFILSLTLYFLSLNHFEGFFEYSISGILVFNKKFRISLYLLRIIGIYLVGLLGIISFVLIFYFSKLWITGNSPENITLRISSYVLKTYSYPLDKYILTSLISGIFIGFLFYYRFLVDEHKYDLRLFLNLFLFSFIVNGNFFINYYIEFNNYLFVLLIKNFLLDIGLQKFNQINFSVFLFKILLSSFFNFLGIFIFSLPMIYLYEKTKEIKEDE